MHATSKAVFPEIFCHKKYFFYVRTLKLMVCLYPYGPIGIKYVSSLVFILYPLNINGLFFFFSCVCLMETAASENVNASVVPAP